MNKKSKVDLPSSIHQRLLNLSKQEEQDYQFVLTRFALERFLYRLSKSPFSKQFILKGAMLFSIWTGKSHRPTKDLDLLGYCDDNRETLIALIEKISTTEVEPDGLIFNAENIKLEDIREGQEYQGQRVRLTANLGRSQILVQIDIGFGDITTPAAEEIDYPSLLGLPCPRIRVYPKETVISEKLQAMVALGMLNSRMKDYYDIWIISKQFDFKGPELVSAIRATFDRRNTAMPEQEPPGLTDEFCTDQKKVVQWKAFLARNRLLSRDIFSSVVNDLRIFLMDPLISAAKGEAFPKLWKAGGPWSL
jgi:predicted nucleotidyltransferase component of viral defense system